MDFAIARETIATNETIFKGNVQQSIDCDITLPEYCPDILRILKCQLIPRTSSYSINGDRLSIDGSALMRILYIDETAATIHSYEQICPFNKSVDVGNIVGTASTELDCELEYVNCRAVNQRRIDINAAINIKINVSAVKEKQILSSASGNGIQIRTEGTESITIKGFTQKTISVDETLELSRSDSAIAQLIRYDGNVILSDVKVITNKLLIKGELVIKMLYSADDKSNKIESLSHALPISQIIDVDGLDDTDKCDVRLKLSSLDIALRSDSNGELRLADIAAKISATAISAKNINLQVINEAYSVKCALATEKQNIRFISIGDSVNDVFLFHGTLDLASIGISSVIDVWINSTSSNASVDGKKLKVSGSIALSLLVLDSSNQVSYLERQVDFENGYDLNESYSNAQCDISVSANAIDHIAHSGDKIDVRAELKIDAVIFKVCQKNIITRLQPDEANTSITSPCALTIYFCDEKESVWDIAKKYNTTVEAVMSENELESEIIDKPCMLMIPGV